MVKRQIEYKKERISKNSHCTVDTKSKKIFSVKKVTDEHVHDSKMLPQLVEDIVKSKNITVCKVFADVVYDSNEIFRCLVDNGILPCIKVRRNAQVKKINHILRNLSELYLKEKRFTKMEGQSVSYGKRDGL
jgi:Transposase DDE domain